MIDGMFTINYPLASQNTNLKMKTDVSVGLMSGLKIMEESMQVGPTGSIMVATSLSDYKDVKGVKYPYSMSQSMGPQALEIKVLELEVNGNIDNQNAIGPSGLSITV